MTAENSHKINLELSCLFLLLNLCLALYSSDFNRFFKRKLSLLFGTVKALIPFVLLRHTVINWPHMCTTCTRLSLCQAWCQVPSSPPPLPLCPSSTGSWQGWPHCHLSSPWYKVHLKDELVISSEGKGNNYRITEQFNNIFVKMVMDAFQSTKQGNFGIGPNRGVSKNQKNPKFRVATSSNYQSTAPILHRFSKILEIQKKSQF